MVEDGDTTSSPADPALPLGARVGREAALVDEPKRVRARPRAVCASAQLELFAWAAAS